MMRPWLVVSLLCLGPTQALAQAAAPSPLDQPGLRLKAQLEIGAQFFPGGASALLGNGLSYGLVVAWQPRWYAGLEAAYEGANYDSLTQLGDDEISVFENGAQVAYKVSPRLGRIEGYALAGVAFSTVSEIREENEESLLDGNTMWKVPIGVGFDIHMADAREPRVPHFVVGARGVYRFVFNHPFRAVSGRGADQITVTALIGLQW